MPDMEDPAATPGEEEELAARIDEAVKQTAPLAASNRSRFLPIRLLDHLIEFIGAISMLGITALLFANAVGRYAFSNPIIWSSEVATSLILWIAVIGMLISLRRGELLTVKVLTRKVTPNQRRYMQSAAGLLSAVAFGYLAWLGWDYLQAFGGDVTTVLRWPKGLYTSAIPIGIGAIAIGFLVQAINVLRGHASLDGSDVDGPASGSRGRVDEGTP